MKNNLPTIFITILSGGSGKRLWPASSLSCPKQFLLFDYFDYSLFDQTLIRVNGFIKSSKAAFDVKPIIVSSSNSLNKIQESITRQNFDCYKIFVEPLSKNTAPAISIVTKFINDIQKNAIHIILPSDQFIADNDAFNKALLEAISNVLINKFICLGIKPTFPSTEYGYIKINDNSKNDICKIVDKFIEKPPIDLAVKYID